MERELENLEKALAEYASAQIQHERAREALELARATALLSGVIAGKNAEEREAQARTTLAEQYQAVRVAQETLTWAWARLEMAREHLSVAKIIREVSSGSRQTR
jgi:uncharacterized membrane protein YqiK